MVCQSRRPSAVASHTANSFQDGELLAALPDATAVYDIELSNDIPARTPHVDWAWDEPNVHFLCEIKDPESLYAKDDDDGVSEILKRIAEGSYLIYLADKAYFTALHHTPSHRSPKTYIAVIGIDALTGAVLDAAGLGITRALKDRGTSIPAIAVNIERWNLLLNPRRLERVS
jgi:hypothetical protein